MAETKDVIATNLRTLRKVRGLSQPELAAQVGISPRTLARLEAGEVADPSINHVRALSRALGVTVDLLSECEDRKSTRLNSSHSQISYAVFCLKKKYKR